MQLARTIGFQFEGSVIDYTAAAYTQSQILKTDLNIDSASHPAVLSNILYGNVGYEWSCFFLGLGGSYEFSSINTTINRWTAWGKLGFNY